MMVYSAFSFVEDRLTGTIIISKLLIKLVSHLFRDKMQLHRMAYYERESSCGLVVRVLA